jgi:hypothetical protein
MSRKGPILLALAALLIGTSHTATSQDAVALVASKQPIPKGYKTYSLFLVCNPQWLDPANNAGLYELYEQFLSFGRAIGAEHAAVWFWSSNSYQRSDAALAKVVDVDRSIRFCKAWNLTPDEGPHLVITSTYPDESKLTSGLPPDTAVYKLGNMSPPDITKLLLSLTDQLVASGKVESPSSTPPPSGNTSGAAGPPPPPPPPPSSLWVRLLVATQQTINTFGCAWSVKINAGPVSADLKSCNRT